MTTNQEGLHATVRALTSTTRSYNEDWHALFDADGISAGPFNARMLAWINATLGTSYTNLNGAMQAFAVEQGFANWASMNTFVTSSASFLLSRYGPYGSAMAFSDASIKIDDAANTLDYSSQGTISSTTGALLGPGSKLTYTAPSVKLTEQADGNIAFQAHNLYLNSAAPANQSITVVSGASYAVTITGSVSVTASGAATGTWTAGTNTFTAATTTLTLGSTSGSGTVHLRRTPSVSTYVATAGAIVYGLPYVYSGGSLDRQIVESASTNLALWSNDFTNASWTKSNMTAALTATGPDGVANSASTLTATAGNATALQAITSGSSSRVTSTYIKRRTGSGNIDLTQDNGTTWTTQTVTSSWTRVSLAAVTSTNPTVGIRIVTSGDEVDVYCFDHETGAAPTSPIITFGSTVTRAADVQATSVALFPYVDGGAVTIFAEWSMPVFAASRSIANIRLNNSNIVSLETGPSTTARHNGYIASGGVASYNAGLTSQPAFVGNKLYRSLLAVDATSGFVAGDGEVSSEDLSIVMPTGLTFLNYGAYGTAGNQLNGGLVKVAVLPRKVSQSEAQEMTSFLNVYAEGDSITFQGGTDAYPILYRQLSAYGVRVTNSAVSGSTIADLESRAAALDGNLVSGLRNVLVVLAGHNDIEISGRTATQVIADLSAYCAARKAAGWRVVVATMLPSTFAGFNAARATVNAAITDWAGTYVDAVWNVGADATIGPDAAASNATYYADGTHLTSAGRAIAAASLKPVLDGLVV